MPMSPVEIVENEALKLSLEDRADLADRLWLSALGGDVVQAAESFDEAWEAEIAERMRQIESSDLQSRSWSEVMNELRAKHG